MHGVARLVCAGCREPVYRNPDHGTTVPLVGRQEEVGLLLRAWEGSCHGRGQVVLIQGRPGSASPAWWKGCGRRAARIALGGDPLFSVSHGERLSSDHRTSKASVRLAAGG